MNSPSPSSLPPCWPRRVRVAATVLTTISAALLATACSDSVSTTGGGTAGGSSLSATAVAYSRCMRSHGVPEYPDPNSSGQLRKITPGNEQQLGVSQTRFNTAQAACQRLWPYQAPTQAQQRSDLAAALNFARCMRSRGLPSFPDPITDPSSGRAEFVIHTGQVGFNPRSPQTLAKVGACEHVLPPSMRRGGPDAIEARITP